MSIRGRGSFIPMTCRGSRKHSTRTSKQAEEALRDSRERYQLFFNHMTEGFALHEIICDENGRPDDYRFLAVYPSCEKLTRLKGKDIIGKTVREVIPPIESQAGGL